MCVDGRGTDVELHLAMFGHMVKLFGHNVWQSFIMEMASTINDGPTVQARPSAHADTPHNNQMAVEAEVPVANQTQKYHNLAAK
jgi:hypothetical protein